MQIDLNRFKAAFFEEATEHLEQMEAALLVLEESPKDGDLLNTIFRAAHSIKGSSTTFGIDEVGRFTHVLENLLDRVREGAIDATPNLIELLLTSIDVIEGLIANARDGDELPANLNEVTAQLHEANGGALNASSETSVAETKQQPATEDRYRVTIIPSKEFFRYGLDPLLLIRELGELGTIESVQIDDSNLPSLAELDAECCYLRWTVELTGTVDEKAIGDVFLFIDEDSRYQVEVLTRGKNADSNEPNGASSVAQVNDAQVIDCDGSAERDPAATKASSMTLASPNPDPKSASDSAASAKSVGRYENETVRVDRRRLDDLINQIGELVIGASMVEQETRAATDVTIDSLATMNKIVRDLQDMSLGLRMVPIAATFQKVNRIVRDTSRKIGKSVEFITEGDDTELDKTVVDQIGDPLIHMVRNSVDHGIETPQERLASGKPETGIVRLRAYQQGGNVYIELSDDGKGLNRARILEKAIEKGLIDRTANLSESEIDNLIFLPGFSTASAVTELSGRGVGMDVVRRNVESLQGSVSVSSQEGIGSTFTVRLPLTLAILDGLLIRLGDEVFVMPLLSVVESISVAREQVRQVLGVGDAILLRGETVPILWLEKALAMAPPELSHSILMVIVEDEGRRIALPVDELLGQQQIVVKNLESNFKNIMGVAGATILGDGRVALILDIPAIATLQTQKGGSQR
jgi:two-component system, chemotaxis family, sensor kinase CheA